MMHRTDMRNKGLRSANYTIDGIHDFCTERTGLKNQCLNKPNQSKPEQALDSDAVRKHQMNLFGKNHMKMAFMKNQRLNKPNQSKPEQALDSDAVRKHQMNLFGKNHMKMAFMNQGDETLIKEVTSYELTRTSIEQKFNKYSELSKLREELLIAKNIADEERSQKEKFADKLRELEQRLNSICGGSLVLDNKEFRKLENENASLKAHVRDLKEEVEEVKQMAAENGEQFLEYRVKYLQAQQEAEEYKRQINVFDHDNKQVSEQIQAEILKMKMQFQEKLHELSPLPDVLKGAQIQLQEAKQLQSLAEESTQQLSNELQRVNDKLIVAVNSFTHEKAERHKVMTLNESLMASNEEKQHEIDRLSKMLEEYKFTIKRLEERHTQLDLRAKEKYVECSQLQKELEELREESSRSMSRARDRAEGMRRYLQTQVSELERQLVQCRAQCRSCQKERNDMRTCIQAQVNSLKENFDFAEIRLRSLQNQIAALKNSYTIVLADDDDETGKVAVN